MDDLIERLRANVEYIGAQGLADEAATALAASAARIAALEAEIARRERARADTMLDLCEMREARAASAARIEVLTGDLLERVARAIYASRIVRPYDEAFYLNVAQDMEWARHVQQARAAIAAAQPAPDDRDARIAALEGALHRVKRTIAYPVDTTIHPSGFRPHDMNDDRYEFIMETIGAALDAAPAPLDMRERIARMIAAEYGPDAAEIVERIRSMNALDAAPRSDEEYRGPGSDWYRDNVGGGIEP